MLWVDVCETVNLANPLLRTSARQTPSAQPQGFAAFTRVFATAVLSKCALPQGPPVEPPVHQGGTVTLYISCSIS